MVLFIVYIQQFCFGLGIQYYYIVLYYTIVQFRGYHKNYVKIQTVWTNYRYMFSLIFKIVIYETDSFTDRSITGKQELVY